MELSVDIEEEEDEEVKSRDGVSGHCSPVMKIAIDTDICLCLC